MPSSTHSTTPALLPRIESRIVVVRDLRVMIDADPAVLYGVTTKRLNEQVKRNADRFPGDFMFKLDAAEKAEGVANCDHLQKLKFSKVLPYAFTEHGAIQAANVLASPQAVEMGIFVVRAFVRMRELAAVHVDLARRLDELEHKTEGIALAHDTSSRNTLVQLKQLFDAIRQLMTPPDPPKRPIGFVTQQDKGKKTSGAGRKI
jgi:ORF6N domain